MIGRVLKRKKLKVEPVEETKITTDCHVVCISADKWDSPDGTKNAIKMVVEVITAGPLVERRTGCFFRREHEFLSRMMDILKIPDRDADLSVLVGRTFSARYTTGGKYDFAFLMPFGALKGDNDVHS